MVSVKAALALVAVLPTAFAAWVPYQISPAANPELCVAAGDANGAGLKLAKCDDPTTQWKYSTKSGKVRSVANSLCTDVKDGEQKNGTPLQMYNCYKCNTHQVFDFVGGESDGKQQIQWFDTPYCWDLTDGKLEVGTTIQTWRCVDYNDNQKWVVHGDIPDCEEQKAAKRASKKRMD